jgi:anhydro-N-acetylmuramic acid kinase
LAKDKSDKITMLGVMSGTSLDGLDLALCGFSADDNTYSCSIIKAQTIPYTRERKEKLFNAKNATALQYFHLNHLYGKYIAAEVHNFLKDCPEKPTAIASHGHTIFHQPGSGFTAQIGCGATIAAQTQITTVCDFRSLDVANGGQGAPLVPVGDELLFGKYAACLNLGGIANISFSKNGQRRAFDICFANMALNFLAEKLGKSYDESGNFAASGKNDGKLLAELKRALSSDKKLSLAREQFEATVIPLLSEFHIPAESKLATFCHFICDEICNVLNREALENVLITGGGAYNTYLINLIREKFNGKVIIPDDKIIQFKEALIFAFLGYLRLNKKVNTLKQVTGAHTDSIGGAVYFIKD